jgi:dTDP-4-dehydrorhamnose 3,5-epimerase
MTITPTHIKGLVVIEPTVASDNRGEFYRVYCARVLEEYIGKPIVQINHSVNTLKGTLRGLHYQLPPFAEGKYIRCVVGAVYDVAVDLRAGSPTFLQHYGVELSATNRRAIYIPPGFAHGFITLADDSQLIYHHTEFYQPGVEAGIHHSDPTIHISWPLAPAIVSDRDLNLPLVTSDFKGITI